MSAALGVSGPALVAALQGYDESRSDDLREDPFVRVPRQIRSEFGASIAMALEAFVGASYFHGTRSADPGVFVVEGILPLGNALEGIWSHLRALAGEDISDSEWVSFRESLVIDAGEGGRRAGVPLRLGAVRTC